MRQRIFRNDFVRLAVLAGFAGWTAMAQLPGNQAGDEPYIADGVVRFQMIEPGRSTGEERSFAIVVARDRSGSVYRSQERPQGKLVNLWVKETGILYLIDFAQRTVEVLDQMDHHPSSRVSAAAKMSPEGANRQVAGLECVPQPVFGMREGKRVQGGEKCFATDPAGLLLSSKTEMSFQGKTLLEETEITSVRRGVEPDASWFEVPADFRVVKRAGR